MKDKRAFLSGIDVSIRPELSHSVGAFAAIETMDGERYIWPRNGGLDCFLSDDTDVWVTNQIFFLRQLASFLEDHNKKNKPEDPNQTKLFPEES